MDKISHTGFLKLQDSPFCSSTFFVQFVGWICPFTSGTMFWRSGLGWILCLGWIVTGLGESITSHILDEYQMSTQTPILPHGKHSLTPSLSTPSDLVLSKRDSVLTPAEQAQIMVEFQKNPNATLWTVFSKEVIGHWRHMRKHPLIFLMVYYFYDHQ